MGTYLRFNIFYIALGNMPNQSYFGYKGTNA